MACIPPRSHDEKRLLAAFVRYYSKHAGREYVFQRRLDVGNRDSQPEALYVDAASGARLVIERKSVVWPRDFAETHASLHMVTKIVDGLIARHLEANRAYRLWMPEDLRGRLADLRAHGHSIAENIVKRIGDVHGGKIIGSTAAGREWRFRVEAGHERDWDEPAVGIKYVFGGRTSGLDWGEVPEGLRAEVGRLLRSASRKFEGHSGAIRVLAVDLIGSIRHPLPSTLRELFSVSTVPSNIDDVWFSTHDLVTEIHYGWIHRQLWPELREPYSELCGETVVPVE